MCDSWLKLANTSGYKLSWLGSAHLAVNLWLADNKSCDWAQVHSITFSGQWKRNKTCVPSMIHSSRPTSPSSSDPCSRLFCFARFWKVDGHTDGRADTTCKNSDHTQPRGSIKSLTDISALGWSMNTSSASSPSNKTDTDFSSYSSSEK